MQTRAVSLFNNSRALVRRSRLRQALRRVWGTVRRLAGQLEDIFRSLPTTAGVRNDWDSENSGVKLKIDPDRANLAGVTNQDIAASSTSAMSGMQLTTFQEGNKEIPVVAWLKMDERAQLSDIENLYVYASQGTAKIPLVQVSKSNTQWKRTALSVSTAFGPSLCAASRGRACCPRKF